MHYSAIILYFMSVLSLFFLQFSKNAPFLLYNFLRKINGDKKGLPLLKQQSFGNI